MHSITRRIESAAKKSNRSINDITLIGVTKTVEVDAINDSMKLGIENIGENKVQEIERKYALIEGKVNWHMIGHLQSNKVKYIIDKVQLIHSLDRLSLAKELQKRGDEKDLFTNALIQVNIAEEESKHGLRGEEVIPFLESILKFNRIRVFGLMTMAPFTDDPEKVRYVFRQLKGLSNDIMKKGYDGLDMKYLSMGMSNDFEVAIEEGSNMVRIGTSIYGKRNY